MMSNVMCLSLLAFCFVQVKNLRSSVSRGAIACIGDLFSLLGRAMEQVRGGRGKGRGLWEGW